MDRLKFLHRRLTRLHEQRIGVAKQAIGLHELVGDLQAQGPHRMVHPEDMAGHILVVDEGCRGHAASWHGKSPPNDCPERVRDIAVGPPLPSYSAARTATR